MFRRNVELIVPACSSESSRVGTEPRETEGNFFLPFPKFLALKIYNYSFMVVLLLLFKHTHITDKHLFEM